MRKEPRIRKHRKAVVFAGIIFAMLSPFLVGYLIFYWNPGSDLFTGLILRFKTVVTPAPGQTPTARGRMALTQDKLGQLKRNDYKVVTGDELLRLKKRPRGFLFVSVLPRDFVDPVDDKFARLRDITVKAIDLKADVIIDASIGDHLHTYPVGLQLAKKLHSKGIKRFVIFDGGHHVAGLPLEPEALLVPVTKWQGDLYLDHAFTRDAIKIKDLRRVMKTEDIQSYVALFPRLGMTIKTPSGMAGLARQALLTANKTPVEAVERPIDVTRAVGRSVERRGAVFTSVELPGEEPANMAVSRANSLIASAATRPRDRRVYLGITYGISHYFGLDGPPEAKEAEVERRLTANTPSLEVVSEPLSGKDIYARKLFHWE
ncbi:MAG: hypothetical protein ACYC1U_04155 [Candidatus Aquicultorales bacterium]